MKSSPAETAEEEIDRLAEFLRMKSLELLDEEASRINPRRDKSQSLSRLAALVVGRKQDFKGRTDTEKVLEELLEWASKNVNTDDNTYSLMEQSCFVELTLEIRRRLINYDEGLMDVKLKTRKKWEEKYGE